MSTSDLSATEMFESLTGFEEIAITREFKRTILDIAEADKLGFGRALAFVHFKRQGQGDREARESALGLTIREVNEFFAPETEDSGKDSPPSDEPPGS